MDITSYKEAVKRGENVEFTLSKKKLLLGTLILIGVIIGSAIMTYIGDIPLIIGILVCIICGFFAQIMGRALLRRPTPPVIYVNRELVGIFLAPISKNSAFLPIKWKDILDMEIQEIKNGKGSRIHYLALKCTDSTIQDILNQIKFNSGGMFRIYKLRNNFILLQIESLIDIPLSDLLTLMKEIHKEATTAPHNY